MDLPSIHAPNGLSKEDQRRAITVGHRPRLDSMAIDSDGFYGSGNVAHTVQDVEMVATDEMEESQMISDIVTSSRIENSFASSDEMELDRHVLQTAAVSLQGNISYLIIDTNFILSQLRILEDLKNIGEKYGLVLVIPIQVVRELDGLKGSHRVNYDDRSGSAQDISKMARTANDWIFTCLAQKCPTVKGQGLKERMDKFSLKDDAILDCCLYYKCEYQHTLQILFSNDKNLCSKALMNDVLTVSYSKDMSAQLIAERIYEENVSRFGYIESASVAKIEVEVPAKTHARNADQVCDTVYSEVSAVVAHVVKQCLLNEYGRDIGLLRDYDKNAAMDLEDAALAIIRFWIPVFSSSLGRHEPFEKHGSRKVPIMVDVPKSHLELLNFIDFWTKLLIRIYERTPELQGIGTIQEHARRWDELARSVA